MASALPISSCLYHLLEIFTMAGHGRHSAILTHDHSRVIHQSEDPKGNMSAPRATPRTPTMRESLPPTRSTMTPLSSLGMMRTAVLMDSTLPISPLS